MEDLFALESPYAMRVEVPARGTRLDVSELGGSLHWYGLAWTWWLRILLGKVFGEKLALHRPEQLTVGSIVDWWRVVAVEENLIVLHTDQWFPGEAWLGYRIDGGRLTQVGALRPKGVLGKVYWWVVFPIHVVVFRLMARRQARRSH